MVLPAFSVDVYVEPAGARWWTVGVVDEVKETDADDIMFSVCFFTENEKSFLPREYNQFCDIEKYFVCLIAFLFFNFLSTINILLSIQPSAESFL